MAFGKKVGSLKTLKEQLKRGSGQGFIKNIPADDHGDGSVLVRFMEEPDEWVAYRESYDDVRRRYYPVPDEGEPGYPEEGQRVSTRYVANVVLLQENGDDVDNRVVPLKMPKDLVNQLVVRFEKYETICDRDYELFRSGLQLNTTYGLTPESPTKRSLAKYKALDLVDVLQAAYDDVWAGEGSNGSTAPKPSKAKAAPTASKRVVKDEPEDDDAGTELPFDIDELATKADDDDDVDAQNVIADLAEQASIDPDDYGTWAEVVAALQAEGDSDGDPEPEPEGDDDNIEPEAEGGEDVGGAEYWTQEELEALPIGQLRAIARDEGIKVTGLKPSQIIAQLVGEDD